MEFWSPIEAKSTETTDKYSSCIAEVERVVQLLKQVAIPLLVFLQTSLLYDGPVHELLMCVIFNLSINFEQLNYKIVFFNFLILLYIRPNYKISRFVKTSNLNMVQENWLHSSETKGPIRYTRVNSILRVG